ncbi:MAG: methylated-DNA--[protein]-cysteine S-methyltransferase [Spirochaetes bacterium]|nr:methylated-DNA--[protein]-cysteine S-methyltransferase [Spirochaetota bacterium]
MIEKSVLHELYKGPGVRYTIYAAPVGDIYILGNGNSLKALLFWDQSGQTSAVERFCERGENENMLGATLVLDAYFNGNAAGKKNGAGKARPRISVIERNGLFRITMYGIDLILDLAGFTPKEIGVYRTLLAVPAGTVISYGELARRAGIPNGGRFVGNAMAGNRFPVIIPCHRVVKSDGSIGNYSGGIHIKKYLLNFEKDYGN